MNLRARKRKRLIFAASVLAGCVLALFIMLWWFFNASFLAVAAVEVSGENVIPASSIEDAVQHDLSGSYIGLFARKNIFLYPKAGIERDLRALYPTLASVSITAKDFHTIQVIVTERAPHALWCGSDRTSSGNCLLLDADGLAYANAPQYSGEVYQTYFGPLTPGSPPAQFLTPGVFHSLSALVDAFQGKIASDTVQNIFVDGNNDVHLSFSGGYEILFTLIDDSGQIFERFSLALTADPFTSHPLSSFEYIDLRFGDKVYYKLKTK